MSTTVTFIGWGSSTRAWNTSTWNTSPAFTMTATGAVGQAVQEGDAVVSVTGLAGTTALGNIFSTNVGLSSTSSIGAISTTRGDKAFVTGLAGTSAVGNVFSTIVGFSVTASVNGATAGAVGEANVFVTGLSATGLVTSIEEFPIVWGQIIPSQNSNFSAISPSQTPSWIDVAA